MCIRDSLPPCLIGMEACSGAHHWARPVSYTHLDVYKRQLYSHSDDYAELACLAVSTEHREGGYGEQLMWRVERRAKKAGVKRLFVLTTRCLLYTSRCV